MTELLVMPELEVIVESAADPMLLVLVGPMLDEEDEDESGADRDRLLTPVVRWETADELPIS